MKRIFTIICLLAIQINLAAMENIPEMPIGEMLLPPLLVNPDDLPDLSLDDWSIQLGNDNPPAAPPIASSSPNLACSENTPSTASPIAPETPPSIYKQSQPGDAQHQHPMPGPLSSIMKCYDRKRRILSKGNILMAHYRRDPEKSYAIVCTIVCNMCEKKYETIEALNAHLLSEKH